MSRLGYSFDRLSPVVLLRGHVKGLTDGRTEKYVPDYVARAALAAPLLLVPASLHWDWFVAAPEALLAAVSLLAGALLGGFALLATFRLRLADAHGVDSEYVDPSRDGLDESVAHVLTATLVCGVVAVCLVIGMNVSAVAGQVGGWWAALAYAGGAYIAVNFYIVVNRLYAAYVNAVRPRENIDGSVAGHR